MKVMNTSKLFIFLVIISLVFVIIKFTKNPDRSNSYNEVLVDFDSQLEDILSLDRGIPLDIGETVKNIMERRLFETRKNGHYEESNNITRLLNKLLDIS